MWENENCLRDIRDISTKCNMDFGFWVEQTNYKNTFMEKKNIEY